MPQASCTRCLDEEGATLPSLIINYPRTNLEPFKIFQLLSHHHVLRTVYHLSDIFDELLGLSIHDKPRVANLSNHFHH